MHRGFMWLGAGLAIALMALLHSTQAIPFYPSVYTNSRHKDYLVEVEDPDAVLDMLAKLGQSIIRAQHEGTNAKRGLDLGLARGFSGSQAAKHLMGLAAANFAAGPGKKKRGDLSPMLVSGSNARGELTYSGGVPADYLTVSPGGSSNEWILNKE